jgi:hypothetical protein
MYVQNVDKVITYAPRIPNKEADKEMLGQIVEQVKAWYERADEKELIIAENLNSFQRALVYTALRDLRLGTAGWRGFYYERNGTHVSNGIKLTLATRQEASQHEAVVRERKVQDIRVRRERERSIGLLYAA